VEFCLGLGFNTIWIYSHEAGRWDERSAPEGPFLDPAFLELAARLRERGVRMLVSINPPADSGDRFVYRTGDGERRIRRFMKLLRRAGVRDFVLSFDDQLPVLTDLGDIVRYGLAAAPAHLDLARRLARHVGRDGRLWLCAAAYCDAHLGDLRGPYVAPFLAGLPSLPLEVGIVWTGTEPISPSIASGALRKTRERLGGRDILLYDNFAAIEGGADPIAAYLGPLRDRDARLVGEVAIYMACPLSGPGVSRLSLLTAADWLGRPAWYDPDDSWRRAISRLSGTDSGAADALRVQALEWRGWDSGRRFRPWDPADPREAADTLDDPALSAEWSWTVARYPERMAAISRLADVPFREALLELMARRLAIARSVTPVIEYRARQRAGRADLEPVLDEIRRVRSNVAGDPSVLRALDRFLSEAGIPLP
jgi:hypothetical protein